MPTPTKITQPQVLECAMTMLRDAGPEALSLRELARRLDVKAPSLYRYYPDKVSLERAAVDAGNRMLLAALQQGVGEVADATPGDRLMAAAEAYREFALRNPHLYALMMDKRVAFPPVTDSGKQLWIYVLGLVGASSGVEDDTAGAVAVWSFLHGFVLLEYAGLFGESGPKDGFAVGMEALAKGFAAR